jgi:hypothetical protein
MYQINVFDDGNSQYTMYANNWILCSPLFCLPAGKVCLQNVDDESIIIESISCWKVAKIGIL